MTLNGDDPIPYWILDTFNKDLEMNILNLGGIIHNMMKARIVLVPPVYNIDSNHFKPTFLLLIINS